MNQNVLFISVSGIRSKDVVAVASFYENLASRWKGEKKMPLLFLGLLTSREFLNGEHVNPMLYSRMNTRKDISDACELIQNFKSSRIIIHYNPSGGYNNPEVETQLYYLMHDKIGGIQWNYFDSKLTPSTKPKFPIVLPQIIDLGFVSILQIRKNDYSNPHEFAKRMNNFTLSSNHTHLLLDESCGKGLSINEEAAINWIKTMQHYRHIKSLAISGGIGTKTLDVVERIKNAVGSDVELSIDATEKLRDWNDFSVEKAKEFLAKAIQLYR